MKNILILLGFVGIYLEILGAEHWVPSPPIGLDPPGRPKELVKEEFDMQLLVYKHCPAYCLMRVYSPAFNDSKGGVGELFSVSGIYFDTKSKKVIRHVLELERKSDGSFKLNSKKFEVDPKMVEKFHGYFAKKMKQVSYKNLDSGCDPSDIPVHAFEGTITKGGMLLRADRFGLGSDGDEALVEFLRGVKK